MPQLNVFPELVVLAKVVLWLEVSSSVTMFHVPHDNVPGAHAVCMVPRMLSPVLTATGLLSLVVPAGQQFQLAIDHPAKSEPYPSTG
jgi:hypothetical protein